MILLKVHRWIGLTLGALLAFSGLTGSIIAFENEIDAFVLNREMWAVETRGPELPIGTILDRLVMQRPDASDHAVGPAWYDGIAPFGYYTRYDQHPEGRTYVVALNPHDGRIQGEYLRHSLPLSRDNIISVLYELHRSLLSGTIGFWIVGTTGFLTLFLVMIGIYLWWPRGGKWRVALTYKRGAAYRRKQYDIHKLGGAYLGLAMATLAFTGIYLSLPAPFTAAVKAFAPVAAPLTVDPASSARSRIGGAEAQAIAEAYFPGAVPMLMFAPSGEGDSYAVTLRHPDYPRLSNGGSRVFVDPATGVVLGSVDSRTQPAGNRFLSWMFPTHNGEISGTAGRILVCLLGLVPITMFITGFILWRLRSGAPNRKATKSASTAASKLPGMSQP